MMIGGGSLANMNQKIRENLSMRRKRSYFKDKRKELLNEYKHANGNAANELTPREKQAIKRKVDDLVSEDSRQTVRAIVVSVVITVGLIAIIIVTLF